jgi:hypothetical protein
LQSTGGQLRKRGLPADPDWPDFDGVYCIPDPSGGSYDIRAIAKRTEQMREIDPNYIMSEEELQQFAR